MPLDILYFDTKRLDALRAQSSEKGVRKSIAAAAKDSRSDSIDHSSEVSGGITGIASSKKTASHNKHTSRDTDTAETFDPTWSDAVAFVQSLGEQTPEIGHDAPSIGSLRIISGELAITDLEFVRKLLELKSFKRLTQQGNSPDKSAKSKREQKETMELVFDMLSAVPHSIHCSVSGSGHSFWCTLDPDYLTIPSDEIILKYGKYIPGQWKILAIVDALPDKLSLADPMQGQTPDFVAGGLAMVVEFLVPFVRTFLGRPSAAIGLTPIMIYRQISQ